ncbi:hypothetical protein RhiirA5_431452 [Rhizophagus irregularis]|uniref:Uncharacterized protein n=1 Tax=Rhizophagus irregularis TaxID=588596 RepID=A0A2I1F4Q6_9GLOM|nr:hypothetical protein RhiirA5_431452 [Rhizophagus irregularis]PKY29354.1 hypothetical protein RhiirB3_445949 [Rhizophagus irregularis]
MNSLSLLNLMKAAKRFQITDVVEYLQSYLIENRSSWIYENIFTEAFDNEDYYPIDQKVLQIDDLSIEEFRVWNAVLD